MATYVAESDTYAGWSTGRNFGYFGLVAGAVGLTGWATMHGHLPGLQPVDAGDQLLILAMAWIGGGVFVLMAICVLGSLVRSDKSRGTVVIDDVGVLRQIGRWRRMLRWEEIEGFAAMPYGGVTLIPCNGGRGMEIPRFLDDYRGCIAEIKARGIGSLPSTRLKRKRTWREAIRTYAAIVAFLVAYNAKETHAVRLGAFCIWIGFMAWSLLDDQMDERGWLHWFSGAILVVMVAWVVHHMAHTW
jgi:hypothetical protein